jgi:uncharacterized membrane protein YfcA
MFEYFYYIIIGIFCGFLSGLLGIGGGVIMIPALFFIMQHFGVETLHLMHLVIGTALTSMIFSSISSMLSHRAKKVINWRIIQYMTPGLVAGAFLGSYLAKILSSHILQLLFGVSIILVGLRFILQKSEPTNKSYEISYWKLRYPLLGGGISFLSALLGIGGGIFSVPILQTLGFPIRKAIATSSAITLYATFLASICYFVFGLHQITSEASFGYIYLPAFFAVTPLSVIFALFGAKIAHTIDTTILKKIFGISLLMIGVYMLY